MKFLFRTLAVAMFLQVALTNALSADCGRTVQSAVTTKSGEVLLLSSTRGENPTIFYRADLDVNTDGTARSYHPQDPRGISIALNNMGNAITRAWNENGQRITCDGGDASNRQGACFTEYMNAFEGARDLGFDPNAFPRIETKQIIPWEYSAAEGHIVPCLNDLGYFVSQTSLSLNSSLGLCDQARYVDSLKINAVVYIPGRLRAQGTTSDKGDLVIVRDRKSGRYAFAIHGDSNPVRLGEGSVALAAQLSGSTVAPDATKSDMYRLKREEVDYLVFARDDVERYWRRRGGTTQARIEEFGMMVFKKWGGEDRFEACSAAYDEALRNQ